MQFFYLSKLNMVMTVVLIIYRLLWILCSNPHGRWIHLNNPTHEYPGVHISMMNAPKSKIRPQIVGQVCGCNERLLPVKI